MAFPCMQNFVFIKPTQEGWQWQTGVTSYFGRCWLAEDKMSLSWEGIHGTFSGTIAHAHKSGSHTELSWKVGEYLQWSWVIPEGSYVCELGNEIHQQWSLQRLGLVLDDTEKTVHKTKAFLRAREKESKSSHPSKGKESKIDELQVSLLDIFSISYLSPGKIQRLLFSPLSNIYFLISVSYI